MLASEHPRPFYCFLGGKGVGASKKEKIQNTCLCSWKKATPINFLFKQKKFSNFWKVKGRMFWKVLGLPGSCTCLVPFLVGFIQFSAYSPSDLLSFRGMLLFVNEKHSWYLWALNRPLGEEMLQWVKVTGKKLMWSKCTLRKKQIPKGLIIHWRLDGTPGALATESWHKTASALLTSPFKNVLVDLKLLSVISVSGPISRMSPSLQPWCSALFLSPTCGHTWIATWYFWRAELPWGGWPPRPSVSWSQAQHRTSGRRFQRQQHCSKPLPSTESQAHF